MSFVYTQLASDNFQRPNENPLNPTNWAVAFVGASSLQIFSNECTATSDAVACNGLYIGASFPNDQYAQIQVDAVSSANASNSAGVAIRQHGQFDFSHRYEAYVGPLSASAPVNLIGPSGSIIQTVNTSFLAGGTLRIEAFQNVITVYVNGAAVITYSGATSGSGSPYIDCESFVNPVTDVQVSNFTAGSITQTTPPGAPPPSTELHITYTALATTAVLNDPDNRNGSSTVIIPNQSSKVTVSAPQGVPQPGKYGTIHGRYDLFNILNNPA